MSEPPQVGPSGHCLAFFTMVPTADMTVVLEPLALVVTVTTAGRVAVVVRMVGWAMVVTGMAESHLLFLFWASGNAAGQQSGPCHARQRHLLSGRPVARPQGRAREGAPAAESRGAAREPGSPPDLPSWLAASGSGPRGVRPPHKAGKPMVQRETDKPLPTCNCGAGRGGGGGCGVGGGAFLGACHKLNLGGKRAQSETWAKQAAPSSCQPSARGGQELGHAQRRH